jgi:hypothetical protein
MTVIKRSRANSSGDLVQAIEQFCGLLADQNEDEAVAELNDTVKTLRQAEPGSSEHAKAVKRVVDAFDGDHELSAYILAKPNPEEWSTTEQLSQAATRVLNLARRLTTSR